MNRHDLENRLIDFAVLIIRISELLPKTRAGNALSNQIVRSGTSPALNYGEAQSAESRKDFIHKLKIILKELRETFICLKIIRKAKLSKQDDILDHAMRENDELISIFVSSLKTAQRNQQKI
ncbi:four helix bundle protein [candidate division KSB1 bacterium]|nr:four helix bundle protein [candidate division KSB1 bacterium]RQW06220.1 MAG: four helix bundle protein [candidate division KSB1 bacterium]